MNEALLVQEENAEYKRYTLKVKALHAFLKTLDDVYAPMNKVAYLVGYKCNVTALFNCTEESATKIIGMIVLLGINN